MTTPTGPISLGDVQTEFGGSNPIGMNEYYRGGTYVNSATAAGTSGSQIATSGAIQLGDFRGVTAVLFNIPVLGVYDTETDPADAYAGFTFYADGTAAVEGNDATIDSPPNWHTPSGGTPGNSYWIRVSVTAGSNPNFSNPGVGSWLAMSSTRAWTWRQTTVGSNTATVTIEISSDSGGSTVVASKTGIAISAIVDAA